MIVHPEAIGHPRVVSFVNTTHSARNARKSVREMYRRLRTAGLSTQVSRGVVFLACIDAPALADCHIAFSDSVERAAS